MPSPSPIRIVLADDHPVVRSGIRTMLEKAADFVVVGEASNGLDALALVEQLAPDVLLLDMEMPGMAGLDVARRLHTNGSPVRVLALSAHDDEQYIFGLLDHGASGYLTKDEAPSTIIEAIRGVAHGEDGWISRRVAGKLVQRKRMTLEAATAALSDRERDVLRLMGHGYDNIHIAETLFISEGTVKNHVTHIYSKLNLRTRAEAVAWAWQHGLIQG
jgi:DNA-binding NarL/FixJ family response regulator